MPAIRGTLTEGAETQVDASGPFGIAVPLDAEANRIAFLAVNLYDLTPGEDVQGFTVTSDVPDATVHWLYYQAPNNTFVQMLFAAVAVPDDFTGPVTFTLTPTPGAVGNLDYIPLSMTIYDANQDDAELTLAEFVQQEPAATPLSIAMGVPPDGAAFLAFGGAVGNAADILDSTINAIEIDSGLQMSEGGDVGNVMMAFQGPVQSGENGDAEFDGNDVLSLVHTLVGFFFREYTEPTECADVTGFNCTPFPDNDNLTLAEYRRKMLIRAGFATIADNPPPGTVALFNSFLEDAQNFLYRTYPALETRWIFRWELEEGVRFYGLRSNDDTNLGCVRLDAYKNIEGAWLIDLNGAWLPLVSGIPPYFYTTVNQPGLPVRYEIRQCIEIFPAPPADGYYLAIKGHFGKQPFTEDTDKPTIDGELVYLWALANALAYYGKSSADSVAEQAKVYLGQLVAGTHGSKRYVPGTRPLPPAIQPIFLPYPDP